MELTTSVPTNRLQCHKFHRWGSATDDGQLTMMPLKELLERLVGILF